MKGIKKRSESVMTGETNSADDANWEMYEDEARFGEYPVVPLPEAPKPYVMHKHLDEQLAAGVITPEEYEILKTHFYEEFWRLVAEKSPEFFDVDNTVTVGESDEPYIDK